MHLSADALRSIRNILNDMIEKAEELDRMERDLDTGDAAAQSEVIASDQFALSNELDATAREFFEAVDALKR